MQNCLKKKIKISDDGHKNSDRLARNYNVRSFNIKLLKGNLLFVYFNEQNISK